MSLSWADAEWPAATVVTLTLTAVPSGTRIGLVHAGWDALGLHAGDLAATHAAGWRLHPLALKDHAERQARARRRRDEGARE